MLGWLPTTLRPWVRESAFRTKLWKPPPPEPGNASIRLFCEANERYWQSPPAGPVGVLLEGHLSQYGPNYAFRVGVAGKAIQEATGLDIEVLFPGFSHQWKASHALFASFNIRRSVHLGTAFPLWSLVHRMMALIEARRVMRSIKNPSDILDIAVSGIPIGDLIYDDLLKESKRQTIPAVDRSVATAVYRSVLLLFKYRHLLSKRPYQYYVATHTQYSEYGLLCRAALFHGVKVIETTDIQMSAFDSMSAESLPTYHEGIRRRLQAALFVPSSARATLRNRGANALRDRTSAKVDQIDAKKAYSGRVYGKSELSKQLGFNADSFVVFVPAHIFSDAPHASSRMLYVDYYQWLVATLEIAQRARRVQWIIKPHPSTDIYGEQGIVESMVSRLESDNVHLCPPDLSVSSLVQCADALVTVHGTAGLEFACLGIPTILAGSPFYAGLGFTIDPKTVEEYQGTLLSVEGVKKLSSAQIDTALEVFAIWNDQFDWNNPVITTEVLAAVWGSGRFRDLGVAFERIGANIQRFDPRSLKLWNFARTVAAANAINLDSGSLASKPR